MVHGIAIMEPDTKSTPAFYQSLADEGEVRLLHIHPSDQKPSINKEGTEEPITCTIKHAKLSENPKYEALSYMWGEDKPTNQIIVSDCPYVVRKNLYEALLGLRRKTEERVIWIDAICVNQHDNDERNYQVSQMGMIYQGAFQVVAWLGKSSNDAVLRRTKIMINDEYENEHAWRWEKQKEEEEKKSHQNPSTREIFEKRELEIQMSGILWLCQYTYWTRLWIIQEVVLGKKVLLQRGLWTGDWNDLATILETLANSRAEKTHNQKLIMHTMPARFVSERAILARAQESSPLLRAMNLRPLLSLCVDHGTAHCQDPRDKMFGLYGFAAKCCTEACPVDYGEEVDALSQRVIQHHLSAHFNVQDPLAKEADRRQGGIYRQLQTFYGNLGLLPKSTGGRLPDPLTKIQESSILRGCQLRSQERILYLTPPMNNLLEDEHRFKDGTYRLHSIARRNAIQDLLQAQTMGSGNCLNIIVPVKDSSAHDFSCSLSGSVIRRDESNQDEKAATKMIINEKALFRKLEKALDYHGVPWDKDTACKVGVAETGLIFLGPVQTRIGDILCQSIGYDELWHIAREYVDVPDSYHLIGQGFGRW